MTNRRQFLFASGGAALTAALPLRVAFGALPGERRLVLVLLRGGLDGLSALPPLGDPDYAAQRGDLALEAGRDTVGLDGFFGLHRALAGMGALWQQGRLLGLHAVATPYRERSHFDAQDLLENGTLQPRGRGDGWLGRALTALGGGFGGLAVGQDLPLVLLGAGEVTTWSPSELPAANATFLARVADLYSGDPLLGPALLQGLKANSLAEQVFAGTGGGPRRAEEAMAEGAGRLLADSRGPRVCVLEFGGWDTHSRQGTGAGRLALALGGLDAGLSALRRGLGQAWSETAVVVVTEFGRTVAANGSGGTDHGTASCAFLAGGRVAGGRVLADWPGLGRRQLHEGRDLAPTLDLRALLKGVLAEQLGLGRAALDDEVFPGSGAVPPLQGLLD